MDMSSALLSCTTAEVFFSADYGILPHYAQMDLNKKSGAMYQTLISFNIDAQGIRKTKNENPPTQENRSHQLTCTGRSAHGWQIGRHWLAGNAYFPFSFFVFLNPWASIVKF